MSMAGQVNGGWSATLPAHCPPADASAPLGDVYRLLSSIPPSPDDMKTPAELDKFKNQDECLRSSLSCAIDLQHIEDLRGSTPRFKEYKVAVASLDGSHGVIKQTGRPGHYSLWLFAAVLAQANTLFKAHP